MRTSQSRRTYDYRIQEAICESGDRDLFPELKIPRSTTRSWIHRGAPDVVTSDLLVRDRAELIAEIHQYRHRAALLGAVVRLLIAMLRASKVRLDYERLPKGDAKKILLRAIERAGRVLPLDAALRITCLSASLYYSWCRPEAGCELDGTRAYLHAVIDNYSRRILSWTLEDRLSSGRTTAHNRVMPHSAFEGQTHDEMYFGTGGAAAAELATARKTAREERMKTNRAAGCGVCAEATNSRPWLLQRPRSRMS